MAISAERISHYYIHSLELDNKVCQQMLRALLVESLIFELKRIHEYLAECESPGMWIDANVISDERGYDIDLVVTSLNQLYKYGLLVRRPSKHAIWEYQTDVEHRKSSVGES